MYMLRLRLMAHNKRCNFKSAFEEYSKDARRKQVSMCGARGLGDLAPAGRGSKRFCYFQPDLDMAINHKYRYIVLGSNAFILENWMPMHFFEVAEPQKNIPRTVWRLMVARAIFLKGSMRFGAQRGSIELPRGPSL